MEIHPLRIWRMTNDKTQAELGEMIGVGASQVSQIEKRVRGCSLETALKIERLTGVPMASLTRAEASEPTS